MRVPVNSDSRFERQGDVPYYGANGLQGWIDGYLFDEELVLVAEDGGHFDEYETRPIAYLIRGRSWVNNHAHVLRAKHNTTNLWVYYSLAHKDIRPVIRGGTRSKLNQSELRQIPIPLPPIDMQRRITSILGAIDTAIQQTEALIAKLKQIKIGLLHDLLTRGLDEDGRLRDPVAHPEQFKDSALGKVPKEWELVTLGTVVSRTDGLLQTGPFGSQLHAHEYTLEGVPVIMPQDITDGRVCEGSIARIAEARADALSRHRVRFNDVVFARRGDLERAACIPAEQVGWLCGTGCLLARIPEVELQGPWLVAAYQHDRSQRQVLARAVGSTMVNLNTGLLASLLLAKPSVSEQAAIVEVVDRHEDRIHAEEAYLGKMKQIKKGLMDDLLTGRVRVPVPAVDVEAEDQLTKADTSQEQSR